MISPQMVVDMIKYLGARMTTAIIAIVQFIVVIYLVGVDALHFTDEGEVAAIVTSGVVAAVVAVIAIHGRTGTDTTGKSTLR